MAAFIKLEDSPMFQNQISSLEETTEELKGRCQKLYKGCMKFMSALGEACKGDNVFADSLEAFGGGLDDIVGVSIGGPVLSKFINTFRELATYKEFLRSQVEHVLIERLTTFMDVDLQDAKESRRRFDKAVQSYDQARERFVSLKKNTPGDIVAELEEDLQNSKSEFEKTRFNLVNALMNIEAKKKYEFLESISAIMDAHLRYFKLGYDLFSQLEPFVHQILTYAQLSKEQAIMEQDRLAKRIQEFRTQSELDNLRASDNTEATTSVDGVHVVGMASYRNMETVLHPTTSKETIKQGYLLQRSSRLRGDWNRKFFVLDSHGTLYYYRNTSARPTGSLHQYTSSAEHGSGVFGRFRSRHTRSASSSDDNLGCRTIDLRTSMIKVDAEDTDLRLCFRIISPQKTYTLQAENGVDRMDWVNKITAVISSLLNSHILQQSPINFLEKNHSSSGASDDVPSQDHKGENGDRHGMADDVQMILRDIRGNDVCAECNAPEPDWASLNLGVLLCIECSGVHRNLGVHISKVRSITLDVKVWEPTILDLFRILGNAYCNSVWEASLVVADESVDESNSPNAPISKPLPKDSFHVKEKYILAKYLEKALIVKDAASEGTASHAAKIWEAVQTQNIREIYYLIATSETIIINTTFDEVVDSGLYHHIIGSQDKQNGGGKSKGKCHDPATCERINASKEPGNCLQGCSLLHLACHSGNPVLLELLLQFGADINMRDFHGRTPLHHCISVGNNRFAKFLLRRGARPSIKDGGGLSSLERAMEMGAITDDELFILLAES